MKVIIAGKGSVGDSLISFICNEGHSVTVIDESDEVVSAVVNKYDVFGVAGNGASISVQREAGVADCDVFIAVTPGDELNLLCCLIAKQLGAKHTIARVRDPDYLRQMNFMCNNLGVDMIVNPEHEAAREAARIIRFPAAIKLEKFAKGQVEIAEIHVGEEHPLIDLPIIEFKSKYNTEALICVAVRGDEVIIPSGNFVIKEGDSIFIAASRKDMTELFGTLGMLGQSIRDILVVGGGKISQYLISQLLGEGYAIKIIERDLEVCEELAELYPKATVIHGDATDPDLLDDEGIDAVDACVVMTSGDQTNLLISMFAKTRKVDKVIAKISSPTFAKLSEPAGIDSNIAPQILTSSKVVHYLRGLAGKGEHGSKSSIKTLYKISDGRVEALEFDVADDFKYVGVPLRALNSKLKKNLLLTAIIREGAVIYPHGDTTLEVGDSVVVMTTNAQLYSLGDIIE